MTEEEAKKAMLDSLDSSKTVKSQLEIQKELTPKMLKWAKKNRDCLADSNNQSDVDNCMEESKKYAEELDLSKDFYEDTEDEEGYIFSKEQIKRDLAEMDA